MLALTIWNPWAAAILLGGKDVENRGWPAPEKHWGKRVLIHAGKTYDKTAYGPDDDQDIHALPLAKVRGAFIGVVTLESCELARKSKSSWAGDGWCWRLKGPVVFRSPLPWRGMQGLFHVKAPEDLDMTFTEALTTALEPKDWLAKFG